MDLWGDRFIFSMSEHFGLKGTDLGKEIGMPDLQVDSSDGLAL